MRLLTPRVRGRGTRTLALACCASILVVHSLPSAISCSIRRRIPEAIDMSSSSFRRTTVNDRRAFLTTSTRRFAFVESCRTSSDAVRQVRTMFSSSVRHSWRSVRQCRESPLRQAGLDIRPRFKELACLLVERGSRCLEGIKIQCAFAWRVDKHDELAHHLPAPNPQALALCNEFAELPFSLSRQVE